MVFFKSCAVVVFLIELILFRKSFEQSKIVCSGCKIRPDLAADPLQTGEYFYQTFIPTCHLHRKEHSLTTGLCLHWKRWQYLKKGKRLGHKYICAVPVCRQSSGTCLCAAGGSCAALPLGPASPMCDYPKPLVSRGQRKNMHM